MLKDTRRSNNADDTTVVSRNLKFTAEIVAPRFRCTNARLGFWISATLNGVSSPHCKSQKIQNDR